MTLEEQIAELRRLVEDLCLIEIGWNTTEQGAIYHDARDNIVKQAIDTRKTREVERLKQRIRELEANR